MKPLNKWSIRPNLIEHFKILFHQGKQFIPDPTKIQVPGIFQGRPIISEKKIDEQALEALCPTSAITLQPVCIDLGKCIFCGECALAFPDKITFSRDYKIATNNRSSLLITQGENQSIELKPALIRKEISKYFSGSLKLRQVCAGGDNSSELELNAASNVNFDMGRYGIEFVSSPRHADGIVITGPITESMARPLQLCYDAIPKPKIVILAGTDAIGKGVFAHSAALNRDFLNHYPIDLFIPGHPIHPLTFINGILELIKKR